MISSLLRTAAVAAALAVPAAAQISIAVSDTALTPGETTTIEMTNAGAASITLPNPCSWFTVYQGTQNGPVVPQGLFCIQVLVTLNQGDSQAITWNQTDGNTGLPVPPGRYWFRAQGTDANGRRHESWACAEVQAATDPTLTATGTTQIGTPLNIDVAAPLIGSAAYATFFALSATPPLSVPGIVDLCIANPLAIDNNALDPAGNAPTMVLAIPNVPALINLEFHLQTAIIAGPLPLVTTNARAFTIQP